MSKNILITGCSSGLGLALVNLYLKKGFKVYGISRTKPEIQNDNFIYKRFDLANVEEIKPILQEFIQSINDIDTVATLKST